MPWGGAGGQKLGHLQKVFSTFILLRTYADSLSDMAQPYDTDL